MIVGVFNNNGENSYTELSFQKSEHQVEFTNVPKNYIQRRTKSKMQKVIVLPGIDSFRLYHVLSKQNKFMLYA